VVDDVRRVMAGAPDRPWWAQVARTCAPRWAAGAALSLLVFAPQLLAWKALYGAYLLTPQGPGFMWWTESAWSEVLFSSRNGLLPWAPLMALAAVGLCASVRRTPRLTACLLAGVALQVIANGAVWDWWAGGSFGGRRFDSAFLALCYGLGHLVIRPPLPAGAPAWRLHARRGLVAAALAVSVVLAAGNLAFAGGQSGPTVRIHGGAPAHQVLRAELPAPLAYPVSRLSALANLPARLAFAARHRVALDAYDRIVGVHALGELYPGLNSFRGKTHETIRLDRAEAPFLVGFEPGPTPGTTQLRRTSARVLVGANRRDELTVTLRVAAVEDGADVAIFWNGAPLAAAPVGTAPTELRGTVPRPRRGVNVLEIRAPRGTVTHTVTLRATDDPLGRPR
jgi:hypothetical protein